MVVGVLALLLLVNVVLPVLESLHPYGTLDDHEH